MAHSHRREYWIIFTWLFVLTVLEVGLVYVPGISKALLISGLIMMALVKATLVGLFFMHLKSETVFLKFTVAVPMVFPALYAVVLITEAAWRYLS